MSVYWYLTPFFILKRSAYYIELIEDSDKLYKEVRHRVHTLSGKLNVECHLCMQGKRLIHPTHTYQHEDTYTAVRGHIQQ
jgi:hypothetical protein